MQTLPGHCSLVSYSAEVGCIPIANKKNDSEKKKNVSFGQFAQFENAIWKKE